MRIKRIPSDKKTEEETGEFFAEQESLLEENYI